MSNLLNKAREIAEKYDVSTKPDKAVVYSVSFMPNSRNKELAKNLVAKGEGYQMLDDTPCGKALIALGLDGKVNEVGQEITALWKKASSRYIAAASGNITAFVEGADERSTFCTTELDEILQNPRIITINNLKKAYFAASFIPKHYE